MTLKSITAEVPENIHNGITEAITQIVGEYLEKHGCKNDCGDERRNGSAYCQTCSDKNNSIK